MWRSCLSSSPSLLLVYGDLGWRCSSFTKLPQSVDHYRGALYISQRFERSSPTDRRHHASASSSNSKPKLLNRRPTVLSNSSGGHLSRRGREGGEAGTRLVGGWRSNPQSFASSGAAASTVYRPAPQPPSFWPGSKKKHKPSRSPLHPLHRPELFSWVKLFGGGKPQSELQQQDGREEGSSERRRRRQEAEEAEEAAFSASSANPQAHTMAQRSTSRLMQAARSLNGRRRASHTAFTTLLSDEQKLEIVNQKIESKWWARAWYRPFRHVTDHQMRSTKRGLHLALLVFTVALLGVVVYLYRAEMLMVASLSPQDREAYIFLVMHMRYSTFYEMAMEVLKTEDPLEALPPGARYHVALEEARRRGWTSASAIDWEVKARELYARSALEDGDWVHLTYWAMMYIGSAAYGGSGFFSSRVLGDATEATRRAEEERILTPQPSIGPATPPTNGG